MWSCVRSLRPESLEWVNIIKRMTLKFRKKKKKQILLALWRNLPSEWQHMLFHCSIWLWYILQFAAKYSSVLQLFKYKCPLLSTAMPSVLAFELMWWRLIPFCQYFFPPVTQTFNTGKLLAMKTWQQMCKMYLHSKVWAVSWHRPHWPYLGWVLAGCWQYTGLNLVVGWLKLDVKLA